MTTFQSVGRLRLSARIVEVALPNELLQIVATGEREDALAA
jgi:hypothetical protein